MEDLPESERQRMMALAFSHLLEMDDMEGLQDEDNYVAPDLLVVTKDTTKQEKEKISDNAFGYGEPNDGRETTAASGSNPKDVKGSGGASGSNPKGVKGSGGAKGVKGKQKVKHEDDKKKGGGKKGGGFWNL